MSYEMSRAAMASPKAQEGSSGTLAVAFAVLLPIPFWSKIPTAVPIDDSYIDFISLQVGAHGARTNNEERVHGDTGGKWGTVQFKGPL